MVTKEDLYVVRGLVDSHDSSPFDDLGGDSKSLDELECGRGIETSIRTAKDASETRPLDHPEGEGCLLVLVVDEPPTHQGLRK
jgi:hypothetical protein